MQNSYPFNVVYDLPEMQFKAGSSEELTFYVYTSGCVAVNLSGATIEWKLSYFGNTVATVTKVGATSGSNNYFNVYLAKTDTDGLHGKFVQEYSVLDSSGSTFRPSQGIVNILSYSS